MMKDLPKMRVVAIKRSFKKAKKPREKIRYQALWLLARGYKRDEVVNILGVGTSTLGVWVTKYNKYGLSSLKDKAQKGNYRKLTNKQKATIKRIITNKSPKNYGYQEKFWTIKTLKKFLKDKCQVEYKSDESLRNLFVWCGFSFHKPTRVNKKQDKLAVKRFEERLKKGSGDIKEKIVWYW